MEIYREFLSFIMMTGRRRYLKAGGVGRDGPNHQEGDRAGDYPSLIKVTVLHL